jgi:dolichol-phosphate mannosyltransferase
MLTEVTFPTDNSSESMHDNTSLSIIIPTYNERDNLSELLERIHRSVGSLNYLYEVLVVDDDSPDETWKVAARYSKNYPFE